MRGAVDVIRLLDGSRSREQVVAAAIERGVAAGVAERVIMLLAAGDAIIDFPADAVRSTPRELRQQLAPVLAVAALSGADGDGGVRVLGRRSATTVRVHGSGPIADLITDLLSRVGAGGRSLAPWASAKQQSARSHGARRLPAARPPGRAVRARVPHLIVCVSEAIGVVGPLVRPGVTACLRCLDFTRAERDARGH